MIDCTLPASRHPPNMTVKQIFRLSRIKISNNHRTSGVDRDTQSHPFKTTNYQLKNKFSGYIA